MSVENQHNIKITKDNLNGNINTEGENTLIQYTDNHFMNKLNADLEPFAKQPMVLNEQNLKQLNSTPLYKLHRGSNSPITLSKSSSETCISADKNDSDDITEQNLVKVSQILLKSNRSEHNNKRFRKLSCKEVERSLDEYTTENKNSNELDIIITYLNGQKNLYIHSKKFTQCKLNILMVPTLIISTIVTIISPFICRYKLFSHSVTVLNATITLLISLVNYYKLESTYQIYGHIASQYDKLHTILEMANSRLMFLDNEIEQNDLVIEKLKEFENKIFEIKDTTTIFIPDDIKSIFPIICHINIFSFIKRIETYKKSLILKYCDVKNEIRYIVYKCKQAQMEGKITLKEEDERLRNRITFLLDVKDKIRDEIIDYKNAYSYMDDAFIKEIKKAEEQQFWCLRRISGFKPVSNNHPIVVKHIPNL